MTGPRAAGPEAAVARMVVDRALAIRPGERLRVESWNHSLPWARAVVVHALRRGATTILILRDEEAFFAGLSAVGSRVATRRPAGPAYDAAVRFDGPEAFPRLLGLPPLDHERVVRALRAEKDPPRAGRRTVRLRLGDATPTAAERLGVDLDRWRSELLRATLVDPTRLAAAARRLERRLSGRTTVRLRHRNGTDLTFRLARGPRTVLTGVAHGPTATELPSGLWRAPIVPGSAHGVVETNRPSYDRFVESPVALRTQLTLSEGAVRQFEVDRAGPALTAFARSATGRVRARFLEVGLNPEILRAPESLELAEGTVSLIVADAPDRPGSAAPRFVFRASLAGADLRADGVSWDVRGSASRRPG